MFVKKRADLCSDNGKPDFSGIVPCNAARKCLKIQQSLLPKKSNQDNWMNVWYVYVHVHMHVYINKESNNKAKTISQLTKF
jgi:hypothetical protein